MVDLDHPFKFYLIYSFRFRAISVVHLDLKSIEKAIVITIDKGACAHYTREYKGGEEGDHSCLP